MIGIEDVIVEHPPLVTFTPSSIDEVHTFAVSPCPQDVGTIRFTNRSGFDLRIQALSHPSNIGSVGANNALVQAGETLNVTIRFQCLAPRDAEGNVRFRVLAQDGSGREERIDIPVRVIVEGAPDG